MQGTQSVDELAVGAGANVVPPASCSRHVGTHHERGGVHTEHLTVREISADEHHVGCSPNESRRGAHEIGVFEKMRDLSFDAFGVAPVVGVVHGHELAGRFGQRAVACRVGAGIRGLADHPHAWMAQLFDEFGRSLQV